jgi:hypothetical protein
MFLAGDWLRHSKLQEVAEVILVALIKHRINIAARVAGFVGANRLQYM